MIGHARKFVFVHVPRTGGTLVEAALSHCGVALQGKRQYGSPYFKHAYARDIKRALGDVFGEYYKFSMVRNPWDWVVSNYTYNRGLHHCYVAGTRFEEKRTPGRIPEWARDMSFEYWLRWWLDEFNPSQLVLLTDDTGALLIDEIYRFETLGADLKRICERLNCEPGARVADTRSRERGADYRAYFDDRTRRWVADHFERDRELGGYTFDDFGRS